MPGHNAPNWIKVTDKAGWRPRDSQGELVYKNRMWIFGGWFGNYEACPRDVWNTSDGKSWTLVEETAPWKHGDLPMTLVFQDKMWFMGGWYNGLLPGRSASNEVWWSTDGTEWQQATQKAGWTPRLAAGAVVFKDRMWILGGSEDYFSKKRGHLKNDVWYSANGKEWELVTTNAGWSPRAFHQALVFGDRIWILGGGEQISRGPGRFNDVWCSEDGAHWTRVTQAAPWETRSWFSSVVYRDRMWVLGGFSDASIPSHHINYADLWYSEDGRSWTALRSEVIWTARHEHSALVFKDKIWVFGGKSDVLVTSAATEASDHDRALNSDVWSLHIPGDWFKGE